MLSTHTVIATPNPGALAVTSAGGTAALVGYGASLIAAKYGVPPQVTMALLTGAATVFTSLWHRFFGPPVAVQVPNPPAN